jgi:hypothetical protein
VGKDAGWRGRPLPIIAPWRARWGRGSAPPPRQGQLVSKESRNGHHNPTNAGALVVALDQIHVPGNVRALDQAHVDALAGSIALQGLLVPVVVAPATDELAAEGWRYLLVAGFHRYAAVAKLGHGGIDAIVRDVDGVDSDRAVENIARKALNAYEPGGIALDASFGRSDDAIASEFGRFRASWLGC